jgi:hypothetical protein
MFLSHFHCSKKRFLIFSNFNTLRSLLELLDPTDAHIRFQLSLHEFLKSVVKRFISLTRFVINTVFLIRYKEQLSSDLFLGIPKSFEVYD